MIVAGPRDACHLYPRSSSTRSMCRRVLRRLFNRQDRFFRGATLRRQLPSTTRYSRPASRVSVKFPASHPRLSGPLHFQREIRRPGSHRPLHGCPPVLPGVERHRHRIIVHDDGEWPRRTPPPCLDLSAIRITFPRKLAIGADHIPLNSP